MLKKIKKIGQSTTRWAVFSLFFCLIITLIFIGRQAQAVFTEPTAQPPDDNAPNYLGIGAEDQAKSGALRFGTTDNSSPFKYQLEVVGAGANMSNVVADNNLKIPEADGGTLFVDSEKNLVCVGPCLNASGTKLEINGSTTKKGLSVNAGARYGIYAISSASEAVYGTGSLYGIFGSASGSNNSGISAVSTTGAALLGTSTTGNQVYGETTSKYGIYGSNINPVGLWAGFFNGRVESNGDVSGAKFVSEKPGPSLIPYTVGQKVAEYNYNNLQLKYFDGTFIWALDPSGLYKIRASDGFNMFYVNLGVSPTSVAIDEQYVWVTVDTATTNSLVKIDPASGTIIDRFDDDQDGSWLINPRSLVFDGKYFWVLDSQTDKKGRLVKFDRNCDRVTNGEITLSSGNDQSHQIDFSNGKVIYNGTYLAVVGRNSYGDGSEGRIILVNPSTGEAVIWTNIIGSNPQDIIYDNYYYWVTNQGSNTLTQFYLSDNHICSTTQTSCQSDSGCSSGGCFPAPVDFKTVNLQSGSGPSKIIFDGNYFWLTTASNTLQRISAANPDLQTVMMDSAGTPLTSVLFDGTFVWAGLDGALIKKFYAGAGFGNVDLSSTLTLQQNSSLVQQVGNFNVSGTGKVGADANIQGDLDVTGNGWGGEADTPVNITQGESANCLDGNGNPIINCFRCPDGMFIKNIVDDSNGHPTQLQCRPL